MFYIGDYKQDALSGPNRGWIIGKFLEDKPRKNDDVEVKYWEFSAGTEANHGVKVSDIIECTIIAKGRITGVIDGQSVELSKGDYVVIEPGTPNNIVIEIVEDVAGITIKAPSDPTAKKIIS